MDGSKETRGRPGPGRWVALVIVVAVLLVLFRLFGPGGRPASTPVGGRILRADGKPVAAAVVEAEFGGQPTPGPLVLRSAPTGADGKFVVPGAPAKWTSLRIRTRWGPLPIEADLGDAPGPVDLALTLPATFTVAGIVVSNEGGRPLPDIDVRLGYRKSVTDNLGRFSFTDLPAAMADHEGPVLEVTGRGRKTIKRTLSWQDPVDDLLLRMDQ